MSETSDRIHQRQDPSTSLVILPHSGELVDLTSPAECAQALESIRRVEQQLREMKQALTETVAAECERQGTKTLHLDTMTVELSGGSRVDWDIPALEQLRELGLPDERWHALVTIEQTFKVNQAEAKRIAAANPQYATVVDEARTVVPTAFRVSVKR